MEVGKYTYGTENIKVWWGNQANLKIGKFCSIAGNLTIWLGGNHRVDWITTYPFGYKNKNIFGSFDGKGHPKTNGDVIIGNDVWIDNDVVIMSGIKIGDGAVIANNSHVVENVKSYSVVGGNPAKFYYFRFNEEVIKKLLELRWWDLDEKIINELSPMLCSGDYEKLFNYCITLKLLK